MQDIPDSIFTIRQVAELTGLTEDTIRFYERIELLPYADRKPNGHRIYSSDQVKGIIFLTRLRATGMTLEEIKGYRELTKQGNSTLAQRLTLLKQHNEVIQREISKLHETQKIIEYKIEHFRELSENPSISDTHCNPENT